MAARPLPFFERPLWTEDFGLAPAFTAEDGPDDLNLFRLEGRDGATAALAVAPSPSVTAAVSSVV